MMISTLFSHHALADNETSTLDIIFQDYEHFLESDRLTRLAIAFGGGALFANSQADENIQSYYQDDIRSKTTDDISDVAKTFGEGQLLIPVSILAASLQYLDEDSLTGNWGEFTARAYLTGAPFLLITQKVTGASRPDESDKGSDWDPFNDNNGVSGHAFIGGVPFLTIAHMNQDNPVMKWSFYGLSTLTAISRINDNAHYFSQAALGWYLAWESVDSIFEHEKTRKQYEFSPVLMNNTYGVKLTIHWK